MGLLSFLGFVKKKPLPVSENTPPVEPLQPVLDSTDMPKQEQPAEDIVVKLGFDPALLEQLRNYTNSGFLQLPGIDEETSEVLDDALADGVMVKADETSCYRAVNDLKEKFRGKGYLIFIFEGEDDKHIAVLRGSDELDILRYRRTQAWNYDLSPDDVLAKIAEWKQRLGLTITGAAFDWVEVGFDTVPEDMEAFANEIYEFCPDSVDQGVGDIEVLKEMVAENHEIFLWWD